MPPDELKLADAVPSPYADELLVDPPRIQGRRSSQEITLFKSLGLAIEDVAAARRIYDRAIATGAGKWLELGGLRHADA